MALADGTLCETDVIGEQTYYTKLALSCEHISDDNHPVVLDGYDCSDSACSNCSDTAEVSGWQSKKDIAMMLNEDMSENFCQAWKTVESNNLDQLNNTNLETMFSNNSDSSVRFDPPDQARAYAEVYIGNTCLSDYIPIEGTSPGAGAADGSSAASNVWGLSLSMFAVAGLSAAILSV